MRARHLRIFVSILLLFVAAVLAAQDIRIRTGVELVVVPVSVDDRDGRSVTGLTEQDFTITEDGKKQTITSFSVDPVSLSAVVLIDTGLSEISFAKVQNTFPALAGAFADGDEVGIYRFDRYIDQLLEFSKDPIAVEAALDKLKDFVPAPTRIRTGPFSNPGPVINGIPIIPGVVPGSPTQLPTKVLTDAVFQASEDLSPREKERRKVVVAISDGENRGGDQSFDSTIERLLERGIQVYGIGMDGAVISKGLSTLGSYASQSGGATCFLSSQSALETCYSRTTEKARNQYVLGYVSSQKPKGSKPVFRKIEVTVPVKGLKVHHKKGYYQAP